MIGLDLKVIPLLAGVVDITQVFRIHEYIGYMLLLLCAM